MNLTLSREQFLKLWEAILDKYLLDHLGQEGLGSNLNYPADNMMADNDTIVGDRYDNPQTLIGKIKNQYCEKQKIKVLDYPFSINKPYLQEYKRFRNGQGTEIILNEKRISALVSYIEPDVTTNTEKLLTYGRKQGWRIPFGQEAYGNPDVPITKQNLQLKKFEGLWKGYSKKGDTIRVHYWNFRFDEQKGGILERGSRTLAISNGKYEGEYHFEQSGNVLSLLFYSNRSDNQPRSTFHYFGEINKNLIDELKCIGNGFEDDSPVHKKAFLIKVDDTKPFNEIEPNAYEIEMDKLSDDLSKSFAQNVENQEIFDGYKNKILEFLDLNYQKKYDEKEQYVPIKKDSFLKKSNYFTKSVYFLLGIFMTGLLTIAFIYSLDFNESKLFYNFVIRKPEVGSEVKMIFLKDTNQHQYWVSYNKSNSLKDTSMPFNKVQWEFRKEGRLIRIIRGWYNPQNKVLTIGNGWVEQLNKNYHFHIDLKDESGKIVAYRHFVCKPYNSTPGTAYVEIDTLQCVCTTYNTEVKGKIPEKVYTAREILIRQADQKTQESTKFLKSLELKMALPDNLRKWIGDSTNVKGDISILTF